MSQRAADDFGTIASQLKLIEAEKAKAREKPEEAKPMDPAALYGLYSSADYDPA